MSCYLFQREKWCSNHYCPGSKSCFCQKRQDSRLKEWSLFIMRKKSARAVLSDPSFKHPFIHSSFYSCAWYRYDMCVNSLLADPFWTEGRKLAVREHFRPTRPLYSKALPTLSCQKGLKFLLIGLDPISNPVISWCRPAYQAFQIGPYSEGLSPEQCAGHSAVNVWKMVALKSPHELFKKSLLKTSLLLTAYSCLIWKQPIIYPGNEIGWAALRHREYSFKSRAISETFFSSEHITLVFRIDSVLDVLICHLDLNFVFKNVNWITYTLNIAVQCQKNGYNINQHTLLLHVSTNTFFMFLYRNSNSGYISLAHHN